MALLALKKLVFPSSHNYTPLPTHRDTEHEGSEPTSEKVQTRTNDNGNDHEPPPSTARLSSRQIADLTIGLSDGLTVPFALTAGLSALGKPSVVIYGGLAELVAGGISMGLGGYLGARSEAEAYENALSETKAIVREDVNRATEMVHEVMKPYLINHDLTEHIFNDLDASEERKVAFLMAFHHRLAATDYIPARAYISGLTISAGYFFGGLVPLLPYFAFADIGRALVGSVIVMAVALFVFGWAKTRAVGEKGWKKCAGSGVQMVAMGGMAAGAAMGCVKAIGGE